LGGACASKAAYAAERLTDVPGVGLAFPDAPFFKEFAVSFERPAEEVQATLAERGFLVGPVVDGSLLVACTERRTRQEVDALAEALQEALG
jgi:glycine dehydrogenase subunit 1